jgi:hypothetical protein
MHIGWGFETLVLSALQFSWMGKSKPKPIIKVLEHKNQSRTQKPTFQFSFGLVGLVLVLEKNVATLNPR